MTIKMEPLYYVEAVTDKEGLTEVFYRQFSEDSGLNTADYFTDYHLFSEADKEVAKTLLNELFTRDEARRLAINVVGNKKRRQASLIRVEFPYNGIPLQDGLPTPHMGAKNDLPYSMQKGTEENVLELCGEVYLSRVFQPSLSDRVK
jgi:hypothetical protein